MSADLRSMSEDVQNRVRDLAYMMWETAGRQQGMAMEYWLAAEREVLNTMQAAADAFIPKPSPAKHATRQTSSKAPANGSRGTTRRKTKATS